MQWSESVRRMQCETTVTHIITLLRAPSVSVRCIKRRRHDESQYSTEAFNDQLIPMIIKSGEIFKLISTHAYLAIAIVFIKDASSVKQLNGCKNSHKNTFKHQTD